MDMKRYYYKFISRWDGSCATNGLRIKCMNEIEAMRKRAKGEIWEKMPDVHEEHLTYIKLYRTCLHDLYVPSAAELVHINEMSRPWRRMIQLKRLTYD